MTPPSRARERAKRLIAETAADDADVVGLAEVVSLALTVDPHLLREARRRFVPWRGPELEADLWHSGLVASTGATGVVLVDPVVTELQIRLRRSLDRYKAARALVAAEHGWLPATTQLEEELRYLALVPGGVADARRRLAAIGELVSGDAGLGPWVEGMVARLGDHPLVGLLDLPGLPSAPSPAGWGRRRRRGRSASPCSTAPCRSPLTPPGTATGSPCRAPARPWPTSASTSSTSTSSPRPGR